MSLEEDSAISILFAIGFSIVGGIAYVIGHILSCNIVCCLAFGFCFAGLCNAVIGVVQMATHMRNRH